MAVQLLLQNTNAAVGRIEVLVRTRSPFSFCDNLIMRQPGRWGCRRGRGCREDAVDQLGRFLFGDYETGHHFSYFYVVKA